MSINCKHTLLLSFCLTVISCSLSAGDSLNAISVQDMKKLIDSQIPIGSSRQQVIAFLNEKKIVYSDQSSYFDKTPKGEDLDWIVATIQQESFFYHNYKLVLEFYFDRSNDRLVRYSVQPNRPV
jgi:hypothetical protein